MRTRILSRLGAVSVALALGAVVWAQEPDAPEPPPPPSDGYVTMMDVGGVGGPRRMMAVPMFGDVKPVTGAPFSAQATTEISQVLADGNQINNKETATIARDSSGRTRRDGTIRRIGLASAGNQPEIVRIVDPVAGMTYILDTGAKTAVKAPLKSGPRDAGVNPKERFKLWRDAEGSKWQTVTESLGDQMMAGVDAQGTRTTETIPAGAIGNQKPIVVVSERWYSPDLQETIYSKRTDPRFGTTIYQLTNISRQEPDPSLFQVPADYKVEEGRAFKESLRYQIQGKQ